jgi:hypothetical protein
VAQVCDEHQVLLAGEQVVHSGELTGHSDHGAHAVGIIPDAVAGDADVTTVETDQRGQDLHGGGLPSAVGAEQRESRSLGHLEVDPVENDLVVEGLAQPGGGDRQLWCRAGHEASLPAWLAEER